MNSPLRLSLPYPPSVNHYWRRVGPRTLISRSGRKYREAIVKGLAPYRLQPLEGDLSLLAVFHPPDDRPRDVDNLAKALLDALQHAGVFRDDSQIVRLTLEKQAPVPGGKAYVTINSL